MNTRITIWMLVCLLSASIVSASNRSEKGNGKIVTKNIPISEYNSISIVGKISFEYSQSDASPALELTIDENLFSLLEIKVEGKTLSICPKKGVKNLSPTVFRAKSNSRNLKECDLTGSGTFRVVTPLTINRTSLSLAGSGDIILEKKVSGYKLNSSLAGSGNIKVKNVAVEAIECTVAGSGETYVSGTVERATYSVAGSGSISAFDCKADKAECSVAGSGDVTVYAKSELDASIASSGNIRYRGNPHVSKNVIGSGSVRKD